MREKTTGYGLSYVKKTKTTPTIEKVRFNYRDQVVATSGAAGCSGNTSGYQSELDCFLDSLGDIGDAIRDIIDRYL